MEKKIDDDLKIFIGGIYGESSLLNMFEEMAAIASVLLRQRNARGRKTWTDFRNKEKSFAFALSDGNPRYKIAIDADDAVFFDENNPLSIAYKAANHALSGNEDFSNGAYFWDGPDLTAQVAGRFGKAAPQAGFHFSKSEHDIFKTGNFHIEHVKYKVIGSGKNKSKVISAECNWAYESTAAFDGYYSRKSKKIITDKTGKKKEETQTKEIHTGTVFWKFNDTFTKNFGSGKDYL